MEIISLTNPKVKQWVRYHEKKYRDSDSSFLVEGEHLVEEAHRFHLIDYIIVEKGYHINYDYETYEVSKEIMKKISQSVSGSKIIAKCHFMEANKLTSDHIIMLDGVQDPGNLGMIIRSAIAFGYHDLIISKQSVDLYNDKVIRSTQGALFQMRVKRCDLLEEITQRKKQGYYIYGTALHDACGLAKVDYHPKHIIIFGHEGKGINKDILAACDQRLFIEMDHFESLNVAAAASICMYEMSLKK